MHFSENSSNQRHFWCSSLQLPCNSSQQLLLVWWLSALRRRLARRKDNKVVPEVTTDDYDSTDHAPHPYHLMMEPHNLHGSRRGSRRKTGLSRRGRRPLTREQTRLTSSHKHRAVSRDVHRELAWMETPGGVQLMRIQVNVTYSDTIKQLSFRKNTFLPINAPHTRNRLL